MTEQAVLAFQRRNMDTADGIAGSETLTEMYSANARKAATSAGIIGISLKEGARDTEAVKTLQRKLKALGYFNGTIDGDFGDNTTNAVKLFQLQHGLSADGVAGGRTLQLLFTGTPQKYNGAYSFTPTPRVNGTISTATQPPEWRTVTNPPAGSGYVTLKIGDSGAPVRQLQTALKRARYYSGSLDGKYGTTTYTAVAAFQQANGIKADGIAGKTTLNKLFGLSPTATPAPKKNTDPPVYRTVTNPPVGSGYVQLKMGDSGAPVTQLQNALKKAKYFTGKADGKFGQTTYDAVKKFQAANGLRQNGIATTAMQNMLFGLKPTASPTPKTVTNPPSYRTVTNPPVGSNYVQLKMGDSGAPVTQLQQALKRGKYFKGTVDGQFGSSTYQAVLSFQANNGLKQNGVATTAMQQMLYGGNYNRTPTPTPRVTPTPDRRSIATITPRRTATPTPGPTNPRNYSKVTTAPSGKYPVLQMGDSGTPVKNLQTALRQLGYFTGNSDGRYGRTTYEAVILFQRDVNLRQDGIAGESVQKTLYRLLPTAAPTRTPKPTNTPRPTQRRADAPVTNPPDYRTVTVAPDGADYLVLQFGDRGEPVRRLQTELKRQGYYRINVTGNYGVNTFNAVLDYQADHGLKQNGIANAATQRSIFEGDYPDES
jgi:peptidoglycan hydrolase-like protein with peptidoglycan-binding domain